MPNLMPGTPPLPTFVRRMGLLLTAACAMAGMRAFAESTAVVAPVTVLGPGHLGSTPETPLLKDGAGNLFGNSVYGGRWGDGTIYELPAGSRQPCVLAEFDGHDGARPNAGLVMDGRGDLFGTTFAGGATAPKSKIGSVGNDGTIFELPRTESGYGHPVVLASFRNRTGDFVTDGLLRDKQGDLFGVTQFGGRHNDGTVFELSAGARRMKVLVSFNGRNGLHPGGHGSGLVMDRQGNLFGSTEQGGSGYDGGFMSGQGVLFEFPASGRRMTILARFHGTDGTWPQNGLMLDSHGDLFGAAAMGGSTDQGTVFELIAGRHRITTLASFHGPDGAIPNGPLLWDAAGDLFGTTIRGGAGGRGVLFEVPQKVHAGKFGPLETLAAFNGTDGAMPHGALLADVDGDLFGTTAAGGAAGNWGLFAGKGTVFELPAGSSKIIRLAAFQGGNGDTPLSGLAWSDGLVGVTAGGGIGYDGSTLSGTGVIFRVRPPVLVKGGSLNSVAMRSPSRPQ
jgi:uncharacterized repeat protein (TIGR03803 family)